MEITFTLTQTNDDGFIFGFAAQKNYNSAYYPYNIGASDYYFEKINSRGEKEWVDTIVGNKEDEISAILEINPGRYIIGGSSNSSVDSVKTKASLGGNDFWLVTVTDTTTNKSITNQLPLSQAKQIASDSLVSYSSSVKNLPDIKTNTNTTFSIISAQGKLITKKTIDNSFRINVSGLAAGLYYLKNNATGQIKKIRIH